MKRDFLFVVALSVSVLQPIRAEDKVDFVKTIKPILENRCLECHGGKRVKGDLRLDTKEAALKGGESGDTIIPGKPDESGFVKRISLPKDHDDIMPPKGDPLTKEQIDLIKKWIADGAPWPDGVVLGEGATTTAEAASQPKKESPGAEFATLTPPANPAAEEASIKKLAAMGISIRPIAQNMTWKEGTIRPQDTNQVKEAVAELKNITSLVDLNLAGQAITDADVAHIAGLSNLMRLHLENTKITDAALAHLKGLANLRYLNLYGTQITDAGLEQLKGLNKLTHLYVWQTKVTADGAAALKQALPHTYINRGEELTLASAKAEEKPAEQKEEKK